MNARQRKAILEWADEGRINAPGLRRALDLAEGLPKPEDWRILLDRLLLFLGAALLCVAVIFFLAYNWSELGRYAKFGLVEILMLVALAFVWRLGLERAAGKAALMAAALLAGALLALVGQTYQTGADTFELFAAWAVAILPWALVGRFPAIWLGWLVLVNLALMLWLQAFPGLFGIVFRPERQLWLLFGLNTLALLAWEAAALRLPWLGERWAVRVVATASGVCVTVLAVLGVFELRNSALHVLAWLAWLAAAYMVYRHWMRDVYVLAGGVLSVIVVVAVFLGKHLARDEAAGFLLIGLVVIALSAGGGYWLRSVAAEQAR